MHFYPDYFWVMFGLGKSVPKKTPLLIVRFILPFNGRSVKRNRKSASMKEYFCILVVRYKLYKRRKNEIGF